MSFKLSNTAFIYRLLLVAFFTISLGESSLYAQSQKHLRLTLGAGISQPYGDYNKENIFTNRGIAFNGSLDYFYNNIGIGLDAGYFTNETQSTFQNFIQTTYLSNSGLPKMNKWETKYALLGPTYSINLNKLQIGLSAKIGYSQIYVPQLSFNKSFFGQTYNIYQYYGATPDYQLAWMGGVNLGFEINSWLGIIGKVSYFSTSYLSKIDYTTTYRDAMDANRNGVMEDGEYLESRKVTTTGSIAMSVINPTIGIQITLGKSSKNYNTLITSDFLPLYESKTEENIVASPPEINNNIEIGKPVIITEVSTIDPIAKTETIEKTIVENANIEIGNTKEEANSLDIKSNDEVQDETIVDTIDGEIFDAPESKYDQEAAALLYKAGETYFAANDFESAITCFNKLKANAEYPRAAYMFALSLSAMGNCTEAKSEYEKFNATYTEEDKRTLAIIFASQLERCKTYVRDRVKSNKQSSINKKYTIQFIAIKKPNQEFPNLSSIGKIETEFFPNKSVYRYILGDYNDLNSARADVVKIKRMGFRDAFIAEYENNVRVNTLDHFKN